MQETTFLGNCDICGEKNRQCRNHHLIPQRLMLILPIKQQKRWKFQVVKACDKCNKYLHPENHLYERIAYLEKELSKFRDNTNNG